MLGFLGVLVVLRPGSDAFRWATLLPVLAALFYAFAAMITRGHCAGERPLVLALGLNLGLLAVGLLASLLLATGAVPTAPDLPFLFGPWAPIGLELWGLMGLLALLMTVFGAGVAFAYQVAPAALIAAFDYTYVVFAVFWSFLFFAEVPDGLTVLGLVMIAGAGILVACTPRPRLTSPQLTS